MASVTDRTTVRIVVLRWLMLIGCCNAATYNDERQVGTIVVYNPATHDLHTVRMCSCIHRSGVKAIGENNTWSTASLSQRCLLPTMAMQLPKALPWHRHRPAVPFTTAIKARHQRTLVHRSPPIDTPHPGRAAPAARRCPPRCAIANLAAAITSSSTTLTLFTASIVAVLPLYTLMTCFPRARLVRS